MSAKASPAKARADPKKDAAAIDELEGGNSPAALRHKPAELTATEDVALTENPTSSTRVTGTANVAMRLYGQNAA